MVWRLLEKSATSRENEVDTMNKFVQRRVDIMTTTLTTRFANLTNARLLRRSLPYWLLLLIAFLFQIRSLWLLHQPPKHIGKGKKDFVYLIQSREPTLRDDSCLTTIETYYICAFVKDATPLLSHPMMYSLSRICHGLQVVTLS